jgi:hypothetical protein
MVGQVTGSATGAFEAQLAHDRRDGNHAGSCSKLTSSASKVGVPRNRETPGGASYVEPGANGVGVWVRERERGRERDKRPHSRSGPHTLQIQWAVQGYVIKERGRCDLEHKHPAL